MLVFAQSETDKCNLINVYIDSSSQLLVNDTLIDITNLRSKIKDFLDIRSSERQECPEKHFEDIPGLGIIKINKKAMVTIKAEKSALYRVYVQVQKELLQAFRDLRNELSIERFEKTFDNCSAEEQKAIEKVYPLAISVTQ